MAESGLLIEVKWEWDGTEALNTAALGTDEIVVNDITALSKSDTVWHGETGPYTITDRDEDTDTVTVTPVLAEAVEEGDPVVPDVGGAPGQVWLAVVVLPDADRPVEVPITVYDLVVMPEGTYDPPKAIVLNDTLDEVIDLPNSTPVISGGYIPDDTLPPPVVSDGEAPPSSPQAEVIPGIGAFFLRWAPPANDDPMQFEVHVSDDTGFIPTADTLYSETDAYSMTVRHTGVDDVETGLPIPFKYTTDEVDHPYYFRVVAKDVDGAAPAGAETESRLLPITGEDIRVRSITAENVALSSLTGDLFSGTLVLGSTISTGALDPDTGLIVGARVELGPAGLSIYDASDEIVISFPLTLTDAAYIKAHVDMLSAEVRGNFTMRGTNNQIATGSELALAAGVEAPTSPPTVTASYDTVQLSSIASTPHTVYNASQSNDPGFGNIALSPSQITAIDWNQYWEHWMVIQQRSNGFRVWRYSADGTALVDHPSDPGEPWVEDYLSEYKTSGCCHPSGHDSHLTKIGGIWVVVGALPGEVSPAPEFETNIIPSSWIVDAADRPPALGFDAINDRYLLIQNFGGSEGQITVRRFSLGPTYAQNAIADGGAVGFENGSGTARRVHGVVYGTQITDGGAARYAWSVDEYLVTYVANVLGGLMDDDGSYEQWHKPVAALGFCHDGTQFASVDATGKITLYSNWTWPQTGVTTYIGASAYDSDTAGDTANPHAGQTAGQHETPVGTLAILDQPRRAKLRVTVPETNDAGGPDDPNFWRIYYARTATFPDDSDFDFAANIGSPTAPTSYMMTATPTGGPPPGGLQGEVGAVNNFPGATPGSIESVESDVDGPLIQLLGNGIWRLGNLSGDGDGNVSGTLTPQRARIYKSADQTGVASGGAVFTLVTFPNTDYNDGGFTIASSTIEIWEDGLYDVECSVSWSANATGRRAIVLTVNDSTISSGTDAAIVAGENTAASPNGAHTSKIKTTRRFLANDVLRVFGSHVAGSNLTISASDFGTTEFIISKVGTY
jgi:hypothetical protein